MMRTAGKGITGGADTSEGEFAQGADRVVTTVVRMFERKQRSNDVAAWRQFTPATQIRIDARPTALEIARTLFRRGDEAERVQPERHRGDVHAAIAEENTYCGKGSANRLISSVCAVGNEAIDQRIGVGAVG